MPWLGASTSARLPTRRISSTPSSVFPEPGGATMCVRLWPLLAVLLERRQRGLLVRPPLAEELQRHRSGRSAASRDRGRAVLGQPVEREPDPLEALLVREHRVRRVLEVVLLRLDRERLPDRLQLPRVPIRNSIRPVMPCLSRKLCARLAVSLAGSTLIPMTFTRGLSTSSSAPLIVCTCAGQVSRQVL